MKNLLLTFALFSATPWLYGQACGNPNSKINLHGNNIKAMILNGGDLFTDFSTAQFIPNPNPDGSASPATIYSAGLWMGGLDPAGNLKLATVDYRSNTTRDYSAGPLDENGLTDNNTCANWDRHFRVTGAQVAAFLAATPSTAGDLKAQFPQIAGWPGRGNPYFFDMWGFNLPPNNPALAGFVDANNDGLYDPLVGDYPAVALQGMAPFLPAEIIWCIFNDQNGGAPHTNSSGKALNAEIQLTSWAFNPPNASVVNNTVFTSHRIINRGTEAIDSFHVGIWVDVDLGCYLDDYVGCNVTHNTMFAHNQDPLDGQPGNTCSGTLTFGDNPPVQTITFLNHPLNSFATFNNNGGNTPPATTDPTAPIEFYHYLTGSWRDGAPFTVGGSGYGGSTPTNHVFPDDPSDPNGWSMCAAGLPSNDRRVLGVHDFGQMLPGQSEELTVAWAVHYGAAQPCNLGNALSDVEALQNFHDTGFSQFSSVKPVGSSSIFLSPNPSAGTATLAHEGVEPKCLRIFSVSGSMVFEKDGNFEKDATFIETRHLESGVYTLHLFTDQGMLAKKMVVMK